MRRLLLPRDRVLGFQPQTGCYVSELQIEVYNYRTHRCQAGQANRQVGGNCGLPNPALGRHNGYHAATGLAGSPLMRLCFRVLAVRAARCSAWRNLFRLRCQAQ